MDYFPLFISTEGRNVVFVGGGDECASKISLVGKSSGHIIQFGNVTDSRILEAIEQGRITHHDRMPTKQDTRNAAFAYIGTDDTNTRDRAIKIFKDAGVPWCVIDDKARSAFITPALIDRAPVVVAIGTEGTAPVLAQQIKSSIEAMLPQATGLIAKVANGFRSKVAATLPKGAVRRQFWRRFFDNVAPAALKHNGDTPADKNLERGLKASLETLLKATHDSPDTAPAVHLLGASDPDLLTRIALRKLAEADVILHDPDVPGAILELCRREARLQPVSTMTGIAAMISRTPAQHIVRLKAGDVAVHGRFDAEIRALAEAGIAFNLLPCAAVFDTPSPEAADTARPSLFNVASNDVAGNDKEKRYAGYHR